PSAAASSPRPVPLCARGPVAGSGATGRPRFSPSDPAPAAGAPAADEAPSDRLAAPAPWARPTHERVPLLTPLLAAASSAADSGGADAAEFASFAVPPWVW